MKYENFKNCKYIYEKVFEIKRVIKHLEDEILNNLEITVAIRGSEVTLDRKNYEKIIEVLITQEEEYLKRLESL